MPAWVRADTLAVVGVVAPDEEAGEIAAGAIVVVDVSCWFVMSQWRGVSTIVGSCQSD